MPGKTMIEAIRDAMDVMMGRDDNVVVFGEDVGFFGGVFRCTQGLQAKYGKSRCFDAPINESGIVGAAVGMAAYGLRPCVEIQFADYMYPAYDQIVSEAARLRYRSNGQFTCPIVVRMPTGGGISGGQTHSQSPEALFTHVAGLKTVVPSTPADAKGLLIAAIRRPFASLGFDGTTVFSPQTWVNSASGLWLWVCPPKIPPPVGIRTTSGQVNWPPER